MSVVDAARYRLRVLRRALFDRARWRREMDAELAHHLELESMQQRHAGASPEEAARGARRALGDPRRVRERIVDDSGASALDALAQDLRFAARALRRYPGFAVVAVLTLAIGIGGNAAIFSAVNALLVRPLPFAAPEELVQVGTTAPAFGDRPARVGGRWSYPKFATFRDAQTVFRDLAPWTEGQWTLRGEEEAERVRGEVVGARYLATLGVRPALGRDFLAEEDRYPGGGDARVVLISDALWSRRFNADPGALGRALDVNGRPYTVVGVLPREFRGLSGRADVLLPVMSQDPEELRQAWSHSYLIIARRKPGVSVAQAERVVAQLGARVDATYPDPSANHVRWGADLQPLNATRVDPLVRRALLVLMGAVGLVLLIACANVANLLLVRATGRRREIAVRLAIGAGRGRLVRQLVTESLVLASLGGAAGVLLAWWGARLLAGIDPSNALRSARLGGLGAVSFGSIRLDGTALAFTAALALLTGLLFGLVPALLTTRPSLGGALRDGDARGGASRRAGAGRHALAVAEVALALVLLAGAGLMLRSLGKLLDVRVGVDASRVLTLRLGGRAGFSRDSLPGYYDRLLERVAAVPGVEGVGISDCPPLNGGCSGTGIAFRDRPPVPDGQEPDVGVVWITPDWPTVMRVPLVRGRLLTAADRAGAPKVVLVNEAAARAFWPNQDPIGRPVSVGQGGFWKDTARVVGVVGDVRFRSMEAAPRPDVYLSYYQSPNERLILHVRAHGDPLAIAGPVRQALRELAPDAPVFEVRTMAERVADATAFARFGALLLTLFATVALALATLGVYGVISFAAAQRTREIGVRVALGATRGRVVRLVVGQGLAIAAVGAAVGLAGAVAATRVLRALLYDVAPSDPATFAAIVVVLGAAVVAASWLPARRAAGVAPTEALRAD
jgi:putative ABC transport system permease protein